MLSLIIDSGSTPILPYLLAILGLLMTWELHDLEVRAGRIRRSHGALKQTRRWLRRRSRPGIYISTTPDDTLACDACRAGVHRVFTPTTVRRQGFSPSPAPCMNPGGCRCVLVGLSWRWSATEKLAAGLREQGDPGMPLQDREVAELLKAGVEPAMTATDRAGLYLLEAMRAEGNNAPFAISRYRLLVVMQAKQGRAHPFVVTAYVRLSELLERACRFAEALDVVDEFYAATRAGGSSFSATRAQASLMSVRRSRLLRRLHQTYRLVDLPPSTEPQE